MRPVRAFHQHVRQNGSDQLARCVFIEECDRIHGGKRACKFRTVLLRDERPGRALHPLHTIIGIECQNQQIPEGPCLFEQPDMSRVEQIITAICENDSSACSFPLLAHLNQFFPCVKRSHIPAATIIGMDVCRA